MRTTPTTPAGANPSYGVRLGASLRYATKRRKARWFAGLPTEEPAAAGVLWNDNGVIKTSTG